MVEKIRILLSLENEVGVVLKEDKDIEEEVLSFSPCTVQWLALDPFWLVWIGL